MYTWCLETCSCSHVGHQRRDQWGWSCLKLTPLLCSCPSFKRLSSTTMIPASLKFRVATILPYSVWCLACTQTHLPLCTNTGKKLKTLLDQLMHPLWRCWIKQNPASRNSYWIQGAVESIRTRTQSCCTPCPCPILSILGSCVELPLHYAPEQLLVGTINRFQWVVSARFVWILNKSVSYRLHLLMVLSFGDDPWPQTQKHTSTNNALDSLDRLPLKNTMLLFSLEFI